LKPLNEETRAKLACAYSGLVWGLFWIPLRQLEQAGIPGLWANLTFYLAPLFIVLPVLPFRWRSIAKGGLDLQLKSMISALSLICYSVAVLYTEVVRAMLLFYLTPIWSALLARLILGDAITPVRWVAMAIGFAGMVVILNDGVGGLPLPSTGGDWLAVLSGFGWAVAAVSLRLGKSPDPLELCSFNFIWSAIFSLSFVALFSAATEPAPALSRMFAVLPWLVPTLVLVVMTGMYATMWGAPKLNPGVVGLLFMTEISVGAITAAIWSGEPFGYRELIGVVLITAAGAAESIWDLWLRPRWKRA
jgi:drug/metabolite transporter (DMT)-like permease